MTQTSELRLPAIAFRQSQSRTLFTFVAQGRDLPDFITVSRIERDEHTQISGYQRPEVLAHTKKDDLDPQRLTQCSGALCQALGIQIVLFRGRERNKRRGFHNMHVLFRKLELALG